MKSRYIITVKMSTYKQVLVDADSDKEAQHAALNKVRQYTDYDSFIIEACQRITEGERV